MVGQGLEIVLEMSDLQMREAPGRKAEGQVMAQLLWGSQISDEGVWIDEMHHIPIGTSLGGSDDWD